jgi:saccharopine dehydrogenase-like NADP-dependent oxidoreductase
MSKIISILGAGRSSSSLIKYLLDHAEQFDWKVRVVDKDISFAASKIANHPRGSAMEMNALDQKVRAPFIESSDLVISMLPAVFHPQVVRDCITYRKPVITPSYVTPELEAMAADIAEAGIPVLMELGLDPGIDHMSAMQIIHNIEFQGGKLLRFESFTGGLVAPENDNNPWNYKFTWNPRNVVLAGQGGAARYIQEGLFKYIPYHKLFSRVKPIEIDGHGEFEGYANRDSLKYRSIYKLGDIPTLFRGTLRRAGFSRAWNVFVQLGMTDDGYKVDNVENLTWRKFTNTFLSYHVDLPVEEKLQKYLDVSDIVMDKLRWIGIFDDTPIGLKEGTPAQILQHKLEQKLSLDPGDKDMIVMWHRFNYMLDGRENEIHASMVVLGDDEDHTGMAKTVGLPVAIAAKLLLTNKLNVKGIHFPTIPELYDPILSELASFGITFKETRIL